jgi:integrase
MLAGIGTWCSPHVLRHTFASLAAQAGVSLFKIGAWMGHTMAEVTELHSHLAAYDSDIDQLNGRDQPSGLHLKLGG